jgi:hypothetical protein
MQNPGFLGRGRLFLRFHEQTRWPENGSREYVPAKKISLPFIIGSVRNIKYEEGVYTMRKWFNWYFIFALVLIAACASKEASTVTPKKAEETAPKYTFEASFEEVNGEYLVTVSTNIKLSKLNYNGKHQAGEGHIHVYRGSKLAGNIVDPNVYNLTNILFKGENKIRLTLATNDHNESIYQLSKEFTIIKP